MPGIRSDRQTVILPAANINAISFYFLIILNLFFSLLSFHIPNNSKFNFTFKQKIPQDERETHKKTHNNKDIRQTHKQTYIDFEILNHHYH